VRAYFTFRRDLALQRRLLDEGVAIAREAAALEAAVVHGERETRDVAARPAGAGPP
jgi:hypothetical protein